MYKNPFRPSRKEWIFMYEDIERRSGVILAQNVFYRS